jgi:hypothetical protein
LGALEREAPTFHTKLCGTLNGLCLCIRSDGQPFALRFSAGSVASVQPDGSEQVHLSVDRPTIKALVDGELTLEDALRRGRLELFGTPTNVAHVFDGLLVYVNGGIRCPSFRHLLSAFNTS